MAKLGLDDHKGKHDSRRHYSDDDEYYNPRPRGGDLGSEVVEDMGTDTAESYYSTSEEERRQRKMRGKEMLTAGLATVATIHAGHGVYESMEKRKVRRKKVLEGSMSPEEAKKLRNRARLQDAASIGLAALGIKGAVSEWKEMNEQRREFHEAKRRLAEHKKQKMLAASKQYSDPDLHRRYSFDNGSHRGRYRSRYDDVSPYAQSAVPPPPIGSVRY
jgi:hypothetical protein